jgi:hypothetical protein
MNAGHFHWVVARVQQLRKTEDLLPVLLTAAGSNAQFGHAGSRAMAALW